jgi:8-oxo-dGTP pyrophosphatase MutT (NUDIX family)
MQMYKIYINEVQCLIVGTSDLNLLPEFPSKKVLVAVYPGKVKHLLNYIDMCEKNPKIDTLVIHFSDYFLLLNDFLSLFKNQIAAGGLVRNEKNEYLFIFRRGFWDLPKGKIEKGESTELAALREVEEETGVNDLIIKKPICVTYHAFKNKKDNRIIKTSHWFYMETVHQNLVPQFEEDIEKAEWLSLEKFIAECKPVYKNILDVLESYQDMNVN